MHKLPKVEHLVAQLRGSTRPVRRLKVLARRPRRSAALYRKSRAVIDLEAFDAARREFGNAPKATCPQRKYLDEGYFLRLNVQRALALRLDEGPRRRVLDLGCGAGYFLLVCRALDHQIRGLDVGGDPLFEALNRCFGVPRVDHRIQPGVPLPAFPGEPFDLITAHSVGFDRNQRRETWSIPEWGGFLAKIREKLATGGTFRCRLNLGRGYFWREPALERFFRHAPGFETRFVTARELSFRRVDGGPDPGA